MNNNKKHAYLVPIIISVLFFIPFVMTANQIHYTTDLYQSNIVSPMSALFSTNQWNNYTSFTHDIMLIIMGPKFINNVPDVLFHFIDFLVFLLLIRKILSKIATDWHSMLATVLRVTLRILYSVDVTGIENFEKAGNRVLIVANHVSLLDALLLALFLPEKPAFAIDCGWHKNPLIQLLSSTYEMFPMNTQNPISLKSLIKEIKNNKKIVIFPEGRLSTTGSLMKIYEGSGIIAEKSGATILPIYIEGAQHTFFSRVRDFKGVSFPKISLTIFPPEKLEIPKGLSVVDRRKYINRSIYGKMVSMAHKSSDFEDTLTNKLLQAAKLYKSKFTLIADYDSQFNYKNLISTATILGRQISKRTKSKERVGILMPNVPITVATFWAMVFYNRVPAMLNFSLGRNFVAESCKSSKVKRIYTSRLFVRKAKLTSMIKELEKDFIVIYLEDTNREITILDKLAGYINSKIIPGGLSRVSPPSPDSTAALLFTPGVDAKPKGVELSHSNLSASCSQISSIIDLDRSDKQLGILPFYYSSGLVTTMLMPILNGIKVFYYPFAHQYKTVSEVAYHTNCTILVATNTLLKQYAQHAHNYDFYKMRYVFSGGEQLKEETKRTWSDKFGVRVLEFYETTETASIAMNTPLENRPGTVGKILPGIEYKIKPVHGLKEGGILHVKGDNVMRGHLVAGKDSSIKPPNGWHNTGDIASVDADGFLKIIGREDRFAKIAGIRVSLKAVEEFIHNIYPDSEHRIISTSDSKKGEKLVLITTEKNANRATIVSEASKHGMSSFHVPREIVKASDTEEKIEITRKLLGN